MIPAEIKADIQVGQKKTFEQVMDEAIILKGGMPGWEGRIQRDTGRLFEQYQRGEPLPEIITLGIYDFSLSPAENCCPPEDPPAIE